MNLEEVLAKNRGFKNLHAGKRGFIIGNGPSTALQDLKFLKGEIAIAVNAFYRHPDAKIINPDYWVMADPFFWEQPGALQPALDKAVSTKMFVTTAGLSFFSGTRMGTLIDMHFYHYDITKTIDVPIDFSEGIPHFGHNVAIVSLMLAFYLGCNPIYLIGCDHNFMKVTEEEYESKVLDHFYHDPNQYKLDECLTWDQWTSAMAIMALEYGLLKSYASLWGVDVFNATRGGYLEVFPRKSYESLFPHSCNADTVKEHAQYLRDGCSLVNDSRHIDTEFRDLRSLITEFHLQPRVSAGSFQIESIQPNGECDIEFACRKCGVQGKVKVAFWFGTAVQCPSCGFKNFIDPFQNAFHRQDAFSAHLPSDRVIALWGAGGIYYKLIKKYNLLAAQRFILVDANPSLQGLTVCGKTIHSPDIVLQNNINTVAITALSRKDEIHATLRRNYPCVEHVLIPAFDITKDGIVPILRVIDEQCIKTDL